MTTLALVGASIERWAVEFRHLQRTEVLEAEEPFTKGQKGSSAMPHKRNPITWERLTGLARVLRGNAVAALENVALWHERDISHSVGRAHHLPRFLHAARLHVRPAHAPDGRLVVYPENMKKNLGLSLGMWNSQTVLLALIKKGLTREAAYKLVQDAAMKTWEVKHAGRDDADFVERAQSRPRRGETFQARRTGKTLLARLPFQGSEQPVQETGALTAPGQLNHQIVPATGEHLPAIAELAGVIWRACYPGIITPAQIDYMLARMYALDVLRDEIRFAGHPL